MNKYVTRLLVAASLLASACSSDGGNYDIDGNQVRGVMMHMSKDGGMVEGPPTAAGETDGELGRSEKSLLLGGPQYGILQPPYHSGETGGGLRCGELNPTGYACWLPDSAMQGTGNKHASIQLCMTSSGTKNSILREGVDMAVDVLEDEGWTTSQIEMTGSCPNGAETLRVAFVDGLTSDSSWQQALSGNNWFRTRTPVYYDGAAAQFSLNAQFQELPQDAQYYWFWKYARINIFWDAILGTTSSTHDRRQLAVLTIQRNIMMAYGLGSTNSITDGTAHQRTTNDYIDFNDPAPFASYILPKFRNLLKYYVP